MSTLALQILECPFGHGVREWVQYAPRFECKTCVSTINGEELAQQMSNVRAAPKTDVRLPAVDDLT